METIYLNNIRGKDNDVDRNKWFFGGTDKISYLRIPQLAKNLTIGPIRNLLNQKLWMKWFPEPLPEPEYQSFD